MDILLLNGGEYARPLRNLGHRVAEFVQAQAGEYSLEEALASAGFEPDLIVVELFGPRWFLRGLESRPYPLVARVYDSAPNHFWLRYYLRLFDRVFVDFERSTDRLAACGIEAHWLPYAVDPADFVCPAPANKYFDIGFVGVTRDRVRRQAMLNWLSREFEVAVAGGSDAPERASRRDTAELYARSRIVVNECLYDGLNFRVFEALACPARGGRC